MSHIHTHTLFSIIGTQNAIENKQDNVPPS